MAKLRMMITGALALAGGDAAIAGGPHYGSSYRSSYSTGEHYTTGHVTRSGTYVGGHYATNPDATRNDNFSTRGNTNPHTGELGTKPRDGEWPH